MGNKTFKFGNLEVNRLGYGAMQLTGNGVFGEVEDRKNAITVLKEAVANGVNFIDTAEAYGPKFNESLIAEALSPFQKDVFIATKGGFDRPGPNNWVPNGNPEKIRQDIEGSLERLKVDSIDLWQLHRIDPKVNISETLAPVIEAVKEGKIKHVGLSEVTIDQIKQVQDILPIVSVQNLYNLANRQWENVLDFTAEQGLAFIPWFPLASGPHKLEDKIKAIAEKHKATTAQIALAWLLKRSSNILLIPGTKSVEHLKENLKATEIDLTDAEFESLAH
ncbi:aldo/keto reductase [Pedobacter psychrodurus]|uniref:aldo/keto reductase n=1 Tax=Pedobacter psychrodurus TaxID=2530456 RepID=UPI00293162F3|nr:aldo/keto reductase [Pedobacter psychrodurus]